MVAERKMVSWHHCWPSLAHLRDGNDGGSANKWRQCRSWYHVGIVSCSLPSHAMVATAAAQMTEHNDKSGGCGGNNVFSLLAISHPLA
jgi:hypothetical protein